MGQNFQLKKGFPLGMKDLDSTKDAREEKF